MNFNLNIKNHFTAELPKDKEDENFTRQVEKACFSWAEPIKTKAPKSIHINTDVADLLGFSEVDLKTDDFLALVTGNKIYPNTVPYAMCYGGHQFGNWAGQLGDGRAINLFQIEKEELYSLQLKGAGKTPYSRTADGLAVLRSSVREYLCAEAMFNLGVSTTRSLSLSLTGDQVLRDVMYNGNPDYEPGAIVARVSKSFIRFGSFQIFSSRNDKNSLIQLLNYTIKHHFPHLEINQKESYLQMFKEVSQTTLSMIIDWQRVGFVHGVMNTDNMSIIGETIDYGPYGWLDDYDPDWTPNTTDRQHRRYRYGQQPNVGLWNLYQLANALVLVIEETEPLEQILNEYKIAFETQYLEMMCRKIGIEKPIDTDHQLIKTLEKLLSTVAIDMTVFFRLLSKATSIKDCLKAFYNPKELTSELETEWLAWFDLYLKRLKEENIDLTKRTNSMNAVNPKYVLRNYMCQLAIEAAEKRDFSLVTELFDLLQHPYDEQPEHEKWFAKRPDWAKNKIGCSMLSCSS